MQLIIFAILSIILTWLIVRWFFRGSISLAYRIPSNKWHTFLGWGPILTTKNLIQTAFSFAEKYGPNSVFWLGPVPILLTSDPKTIEEIFSSKNCINKPPIIMNGMTWVLGLGLVTRREPRWSRIRKLMNKSFSTINLVSFFPVFHKQINAMIEEINENIKKEKSIDIMNLFEQLTLKNATRTILKRDLDFKKFNIVTHTHYFNKVMEYIACGCAEIFLKLKFVRKISEFSRFKTAVKGQAIFSKLIDESKDILLKGDTKHSSEFPEVKSVLDYALNGVNENVMTMDDLPGEMMQFFGAAYDTTSKALYLIILMLAMHPEYQERAYEEIASVLIDNNDNDLTVEQLNQLTYLEMVMNEAMRVTPVIPMVLRETGQEDFKISEDLTLPAGQCIAIDIFRLHRRKDIWGKNAEIFNPDNFLPSNVATRHPYAFIPFTKGLRYCIGQKYAIIFMKITLSKLLKRFKFSTDFKYENLDFHNHIVIKIVEQPKLYVERRANNL